MWEARVRAFEKSTGQRLGSSDTAAWAVLDHLDETYSIADEDELLIISDVLRSFGFE